MVPKVFVIAALVCLTGSGVEAQSGKGQAARSGASSPWIDKAREAERLVQEKGPEVALAAFEKLDREFPGKPAFALRCAQLADQANQSGLALHHYRRYVAAAGARARDEARERAAALELDAKAKLDADTISKQRKESVAAVATPTPKVEMAIMAAFGETEADLKQINSAEEFLKLSDPKAVAKMAAETAAEKSKVKPTATNAADEALVKAFAERSNSSAPLRVTPVASPGDKPRVAPNRVTVVQGHVKPKQPTPLPTPVSQSLVTDAAPDGVDPVWQAAPSGLPAMPAQRPGAGAPMAAGGESVVPMATAPGTNLPAGYDPQAFAAVTQPQLPGAQVPAGAPVPVVGATTGSPDGLPYTPAGASSAEPVAAPRATSSDPSGMSDPIKRFFTSRRATDSKTRFRLSNNIPESVVTFSAVPEGGGSRVNSIVATGESRALDVQPGAYEVRLTIMSLGYPPANLIDRQFRMRLNAGTEYISRVTQEMLQRLN